MKQNLIILALLICFRPLFPVLEYAANYDYIVNVLCVNREQPQLQCNGKCFLMSAIAKEVRDSDDNKSSSLPKVTELPLLYIKDKDATDTMFLFPPEKKHISHPYHNSYSFLRVNELLKPPINIS